MNIAIVVFLTWGFIGGLLFLEIIQDEYGNYAKFDSKRANAIAIFISGPFVWVLFLMYLLLLVVVKPFMAVANFIKYWLEDMGN